MLQLFSSPHAGVTTNMLYTLTNLMFSSATFYLTGSRYFGGCTASSDWDFFVQHSEEIESLLKRSGFIRCQSASDSYKDPEIVSLWTNGVIHIQVVANATIKLQAQNIIAAFNLLEGKSKLGAKETWSRVLACLRR